MMTNERAIELLHRISDSQFDGKYGDERREALEMAVRALFSQQIVNDSQGLVNDCISRKMAIDEVKRLHDVAWANWKETRISANTMIDALKDLPSAQPETHDKRTETHACDLINRQQAIDAICKACSLTSDYHKCDGYPEESTWCEELVALRALSSVQPERKKGKWIYHSNWEADGECGYECSECGMGSDVDYGYCMRCGARMDGENE